jgi:hypothetical protein
MPHSRNIGLEWTDYVHLFLGMISEMTQFGFLIVIVYLLYQCNEKEDFIESLKDVVLFLYGFCIAFALERFIHP